MTYKQKTQKITGWSDREYNLKYDVFRNRVKNFNRATGSNYSASQYLYYSQKYPDTDNTPNILKEIKSFSASNTTSQLSLRQQEIALQSVTRQFGEHYIPGTDFKLEGLINKSDTAKGIYDDYVTLINNGEATAADLNRALAAYADDLHERQKNDPYIGSP